MPELPEVETIRRGLLPVLQGHRIRRLVQRRPDLRFPLPERFEQQMSGRRIRSLDRRAKYLIAHLEGDLVLTIHLGMTGRFSIAEPGGANGRQLGEYMHDAGTDPAHDHVVFEMETGATVTYNDARRFGYMTLIPEAELAGHPHFKALGVEPLGPDLTAAYLAGAAHGRKTDLKAFLMDQRHVAGLGNIYVCEALHRAGLSPYRRASVLARRNGQPAPVTALLVQEIKAVLEEAIGAGGSTLRDYRHTDGSEGLFQNSFAVYGRDGEPCVRPGCQGKVRRKIQAGRSTFACPVCQR